MGDKDAIQKAAEDLIAVIGRAQALVHRSIFPWHEDAIAALAAWEKANEAA